jgi:Ca-activated chloride channel homolog
MIMVNKSTKTLLVIVFLLAGFMPAQEISGQTTHRLLREGNRLYGKELFDESELLYRRALEKEEESPVARFNLGNSLYKQERYGEAARYFGELANEIEDPLNRSRVLHNLGNSLLMSRQVRQSIEAYKEALRNNPGDEETRHNLAFARQLLDEMNNQDQEGRGDEGDQNEEGDDRQSDDPREGDAGEESENDPGGDAGQDNIPDESPRQNPGQLSPEDVLRMLEAAEREEKQVQEKLMENRASERRGATGKNW